MGIPRFFNQYIRKIPVENQVLTDHIPTNVSSLSLDLNSPLHEEAHLSFGYGETEKMREENPEKYEAIMRRKEEVKKLSWDVLLQQYFEAIRARIITLVEAVSPRDTIILAVDGAAPAAKIAQQRQRRYLAATSREETTEQTDKPVRKPKRKFDPIEISPGTDFMIKLDEFLRDFIDEQKNVGVRQTSVYRPKLAAWPQKVIYSSHMVPGEGEHKIMDLMRDGSTYNTETGGAHVIYGGDADLLLLGALAPVDNVLIMRQDQDTDLVDYVNINKFKAYIKKELKTPNAIDDFVILTFCIGNDFLPHSPSMGDVSNAMKSLIEVYKTLGHSLTMSVKNDATTDTNTPNTNKIIDWEAMRHFFINLASIEGDLLLHVAQDSHVRNLPIFINALKVSTDKFKPTQQRRQRLQFDFQQGRDDWYTHAVGISLDDRDHDIVTRLLNSNPFESITDDVLYTMVMNYLTTFSWVYSYYTGGMNNVDIYYAYPYYYTPLLSNVKRVCEKVDQDDIQSYINIVSPVSPEPESIHVIHQELAIIPPSKNDILPPEVKKIMLGEPALKPVLRDLSPVSDMFPIATLTDKSGSRYKDGGIVLLPFVNFFRLDQAIKEFNVLFTQKRANLFSEQNVAVYAPDIGRILKLEEERNLDQLARQLTQRERQESGQTRGRGRGGRGRGKQISLDATDTRVSFGPIKQPKYTIVLQSRDDVVGGGGGGQSGRGGVGQGRGGGGQGGRGGPPTSSTIQPWKTAAVLGR